MSKLPPCISKVRFGSFLAYSPRGTSADSVLSRKIAYGIKNGTAGYIKYAVSRLLAEMAAGKCADLLQEVLGKDVLVVPCPRSSLLVPGALWPAKVICDELVSQGLARESAAIVQRVTAVPKSSTAGAGARPKPLDHIKSMKVVDQTDFAPERITIIDDVITRGSTLLAAASHIQHVFPEAELRVFAMVRTTGLTPDVGKILDPVIGEVFLSGVEADRKP